MTTDQTQQTSILEALFDAPLYKAVRIDSSVAAKLLRHLRTTTVQRIDRHCPACGKNTTWTVSISQEDVRNSKVEQATAVNLNSSQGATFNWTSDFVLRLFCARHSQHVCTLFFTVEAPSVQLLVHNKLAAGHEKKPVPPTCILKIGQYPSLSDIQIGTLDEYEEGMTKQQRNEFVRAINTSAHGFNVAACVHYRRVFESILFEAREAKQTVEGMSTWPEFEGLKTTERIAALKDYLPEFMVEHPHLYSILSKGVHELTEEECGDAMPILRQSIELMIQDKVEAIRKEKRRLAASRLIAQTVDKLK